MAESEEELKSLLIKVKEESGKVVGKRWREMCGTRQTHGEGERSRQEDGGAGQAAGGGWKEDKTGCRHRRWGEGLAEEQREAAARACIRGTPGPFQLQQGCLLASFPSPSSPALMYSAYKLNKQGDNIQP